MPQLALSSPLEVSKLEYSRMGGRRAIFLGNPR